MGGGLGGGGGGTRSPAAAAMLACWHAVSAWCGGNPTNAHTPQAKANPLPTAVVAKRAGVSHQSSWGATEMGI